MPLLVWAKCPTCIQEQRPGNWRKDPSLLLAYSISTWEKPVILRYNTIFLLMTRKAITCTSSPRCSLSGRPCLKKRKRISELPHSLPGLLDMAFSLNYRKFSQLIKGFSFNGAELVGNPKTKIRCQTVYQVNTVNRAQTWQESISMVTDLAPLSIGEMHMRDS